MALTEEDLVQAYNFICKQGVRISIPTEPRQKMEENNFIPNSGEFAYITDEQKLIFSDGVSLDSSWRVGIQKQIDGTEDAPTFAQKTYYNLNITLQVGQIASFILNPSLVSALVQNKPWNFSLLQGEDAEDNTIHKQFPLSSGKNPDARGMFFRNKDFDAKRDPNGDRECGNPQGDSLQDHIHGSVVVSIGKENSAKAGDWGGSAWPVSNVWANMGNTSGMQNGNKNVETRPKNIAILTIQKIANT